MKNVKVLSALIFVAAILSVPAEAAKLEDDFLDCLKEQQVPVSIYLVNGIKLQGQVGAFNENVIFLLNSVAEMVYVNAISTVVPANGAVCSVGD